ncbi:hypothetical protein [Xanthomarina sp. GH4-25]|uniref:hypothetical protein n=1 Tax=Xanthomarina sp. GH4-25 TaxID=3349335 RepID=UPI000D68097A|nr:hypothetical protein DI383_06010 [Flavobacteriaceae bacterium LYZ1037]
MFKKFLCIAIVIFSSLSAFSQNSVNDYKYVIVPSEFRFLDEPDEFQLNSISHFLFNKYGFIALKEDEQFPEDLIFNPCLGLKSDVIDVSGTFKRKLIIELKNCNNEVIFLSQEGESTEKTYSIAYNKALRDAFLYVNALNYNYKPNETILAKGSSKNKAADQEIEQLKEEIAILKQEKETQIVSETAVAVSTVDSVVNETPELASESVETKETVLFAQKTNSGYQLVNNASKVVMVLLQTRNPEVFIVQDKNAIVIKEGTFWYVSENDGQVKDTRLNIKF